MKYQRFKLLNFTLFCKINIDGLTLPLIILNIVQDLLSGISGKWSVFSIQVTLLVLLYPMKQVDDLPSKNQVLYVS